MKPVYALTLCLGLFEGADAIALPDFVSPKIGYSTQATHDEPKPDAPPAANSGPKNSMFFGAWTPKVGLTNRPSVRRSVKTGETYGSDDGADDDAEDRSDDDPGKQSDDEPEDPETPDFDGTEVAYMEPMMAPTYVRTGPLPVDKPESAPKTKSSKKVSTNSKSSKSKSGSKPKDDTVKTAKHSSDDDSESSSGSSGKKKRKGKNKDKSKDDKSNSSSSATATSVIPKPTSGRHSGDDDAVKSRTKPEDSSSTAKPKPSDDSSKSKGKGKGKDKGKTGDDDDTKSTSKKGSKDDAAKVDDSKSKSSNTASKKSSSAPRHPRSVATHQSGSTFDPNSAKGGGKNTPGYYKPFEPPKLNKGYIQAVPPKASERSDKSSFKVKPKPHLRNKVAPPFATVAIDRAKWTFKCDSWEGSEPASPHVITVDMKKIYNVNGIPMLPRQDGSQIGYIAQHQVFLSKDKKNWGSPVAYGTWYANWTTKYANFYTQPARYVRLVAITEANGNPWTRIAELNVFEANDHVPPQPSSVGAWGPTINLPAIPVTDTVDPNTGRVLIWSSWARDTMDGGPGGLTLTSTRDPATDLVSEREVTETNHDMFCPGISLDGNGQLIVTGGNNAERTSVFDPVKQAWIPGPDMQVARGYQSSATTSTGKVFTIGGSWSGGQPFKNGEVYDPKKKTWTLLNKADVQKMLTDDVQGLFRSDNHAWLFGWNKGTGNVKSAGQRKSDRGVAPDAMCGNAVMFDAVKGKILTNGGTPNYQDSDATADSHIITTGSPGTKATVSYASEGRFHARVFHSSVVLPNGNVFITGGQQYAIPFADTTPVLEPEMYLPDEDRFILMKPNNIVRTYHSIALLLPDGRVFNDGGGLCGGYDTNHFDAQLYSPPYLSDSKGKLATRLKIISVSASAVKVGGTITVQTNGAIAQASLVRYGTTTHTVSSDQRRVPLTLANAGKNTYSFQVPSDPGVALPGYWIFIASTVKVMG
ncbi:uncharacterized protein B0J16DRAFT_359297 [Fusarium flagelliforme]|uniref:uncharacterized protein n=1 Tax=Fusarium flagelliforme TaxID=2675880 RepID=UPI001E8E9C88|nr:uncharacterized protein B0J16DRAFT_359297 [Fusarium flagelliforme]KAH7196545.1 hypothetical protein B0J16DRAFT_359297 [Fusarium flagelliforme]